MADNWRRYTEDEYDPPPDERLGRALILLARILALCGLYWIGWPLWLAVMHTSITGV